MSDRDALAMEDDHYYTRDTVNKLLKQKMVIKRASNDSRLTPEIRFNEKMGLGE